MCIQLRSWQKPKACRETTTIEEATPSTANLAVAGFDEEKPVGLIPGTVQVRAHGDSHRLAGVRQCHHLPLAPQPETGQSAQERQAIVHVLPHFALRDGNQMTSQMMRMGMINNR